MFLTYVRTYLIGKYIDLHPLRTSDNKVFLTALFVSAANNNMASPFFHDLKKQASFFFKEKMNTARLALTDVTPIQL